MIFVLLVQLLSKKGFLFILVLMFLMLVLNLYTDLWGLFSVPTTDVFKFFLTIVDDYSRGTWVYFLKSKSETQSQVVQFATLVETFSFSLWVNLLLFFLRGLIMARVEIVNGWLLLSKLLPSQSFWSHSFLFLPSRSLQLLQPHALLKFLPWSTSLLEWSKQVTKWRIPFLVCLFVCLFSFFFFFLAITQHYVFCWTLLPPCLYLLPHMCNTNSF